MPIFSRNSGTLSGIALGVCDSRKRTRAWRPIDSIAGSIPWHPGPGLTYGSNRAKFFPIKMHVYAVLFSPVEPCAQLLALIPMARTKTKTNAQPTRRSVRLGSNADNPSASEEMSVVVPPTPPQPPQPLPQALVSVFRAPRMTTCLHVGSRAPIYPSNSPTFRRGNAVGSESIRYPVLLSYIKTSHLTWLARTLSHPPKRNQIPELRTSTSYELFFIHSLRLDSVVASATCSTRLSQVALTTRR
jgi:hypothetical protein